MKQKPLNIHFTTMGCSKNLVDSEVLMGRLQNAGHNVFHELAIEKADVAIINTCGFIQESVKENIQQILDLIQARKEGKVIRLLVMGCLVERYREELRQELPEVDGFYGVNEMEKIVRDLAVDYRKELTGERKLVTPSHYAYLKISEGCDRKCSFCTIPSIRGKNHSRPVDELLKETESLASAGVKELIIIAQDTTRYGTDLYGKAALAELLQELEKVQGIEWIRLQYTYPDKTLYKVMKVMKNSKKLCHYLDIPLQHISDPVLRSMKRGHTGKIVKDLLTEFRREIPGIAFRTTLITGYPNESEQDFKKLKEFVENYKFDRLGVFSYSPEEGTTAAGIKDIVPEDVKLSRANQIMELQSRISLSLNREKIGQVLKTIADRKEGNTWVMRSQYDAPEVDTEIYLKQDSIEQGQFYNVEITSADIYDLYGKIEKEL